MKTQSLELIATPSDWHRWRQSLTYPALARDLAAPAEFPCLALAYVYSDGRASEYVAAYVYPDDALALLDATVPVFVDGGPASAD